MQNGQIRIDFPNGGIRMHSGAWDDAQFAVLAIFVDVVNDRIYGISIETDEGPYISDRAPSALAQATIRAQVDVMLQMLGVDLVNFEWSGDSADYEFNEHDFVPGSQSYVFEYDPNVDESLEPGGNDAGHQAAIALFAAVPNAIVNFN